MPPARCPVWQRCADAGLPSPPSAAAQPYQCSLGCSASRQTHGSPESLQVDSQVLAAPSARQHCHKLHVSIAGTQRSLMFGGRAGGVSAKSSRTRRVVSRPPSKAAAMLLMVGAPGRLQVVQAGYPAHNTACCCGQAVVHATSTAFQGLAAPAGPQPPKYHDCPCQLAV